MKLTKKEKKKVDIAHVTKGFGERISSDLDTVEQLKVAFNALLAKLDDDTGVTDTDYEASLEVE